MHVQQLKEKEGGERVPGVADKCQIMAEMKGVERLPFVCLGMTLMNMMRRNMI